MRHKSPHTWTFTASLYRMSGFDIVSFFSSTGVGRTGVFIALVNLIERLKAEGVVNVFQTVRGLRNQRTAMVQTKVSQSLIFE